jgi:hypothetical protein
MKLTFAPRGILQIDDAFIMFKNFAGKGDMYNREGDRKFALRITSKEIADELSAQGWNVRVKPPRIEGEDPLMYLDVKVKFSEFGPPVYLESGDAVNKLDENTIGCLDRIRIGRVDLDIRPFDWELPGGKRGRSAYLQGMRVIQRVDDRFASMYSGDDDEYPF